MVKILLYMRNREMMNMQMRRFLALLLILMSLLVTSGCGDDKYVTLVKGGTLQMAPDVKIGKAFDNFFGNTKWKSFESTDGKRVVEFVGDCTWNNKEAECCVQFIILSDMTFELGAVTINDVEMNRLESMGIVNKALTDK